MYTGIIEALGEVVKLEQKNENLDISIRSPFTSELKVNQSIAHDGVCLSVIDINEDEYTVTAIQETLNKTTLGCLKVGSKINLERCLRLSDRLDGHILQGHIDQTAKCISRQSLEGSTLFTFEYEYNGYSTVEKGSIAVNGISLTVVNSKKNSFSVAIIPYTLTHTSLKYLKTGDFVNLEFDILGKYVAKLINK